MNDIDTLTENARKASAQAYAALRDNDFRTATDLFNRASSLFYRAHEIALKGEAHA